MQLGMRALPIMTPYLADGSYMAVVGGNSRTEYIQQLAVLQGWRE